MEVARIPLDLRVMRIQDGHAGDSVFNQYAIWQLANMKINRWMAPYPEDEIDLQIELDVTDEEWETLSFMQVALRIQRMWERNGMDAIKGTLYHLAQSFAEGDDKNHWKEFRRRNEKQDKEKQAKPHSFRTLEELDKMFYSTKNKTCSRKIPRLSLETRIGHYEQEKPITYRETYIYISMWLEDYFQAFTDLTGNETYTKVYKKYLEQCADMKPSCLCFVLEDGFKDIYWDEYGIDGFAIAKRILVDPFCELYKDKKRKHIHI